MSKVPLSVYLHVPFCRARCSYCDFLSFSGSACLERLDDYVKALRNDIVYCADRFRDYRVVTVFFGGGTPSLLSIGYLAEILRSLGIYFDISPEASVSIETNPDTVCEEYLAGLKVLGFNRISFGVQSFDDGQLAAIGRLHSAYGAERAVLQADEAGFKDINVDLMFALPGQSLESFGSSLDRALGLPITHVSCYALTVEEGTPLASNEVLLKIIPDETSDRAMYALAKDKLKTAGFRHYEISNWAKAGFECFHNLGYWTQREYLGLGLGASSHFKKGRLKKTDDMEDYINGDFKFMLTENLTHKAQMTEFVVLGLRITEGISTKAFKAQFGKDVFNIFKTPLAKFLAQGLLTHKGGNIALTSRGIDLSNMIFREFL